MEVRVETHGMKLHDFLSGGVKKLPITFSRAAIGYEHPHYSADALHEVSHTAGIPHFIVVPSKDLDHVSLGGCHA